MIISFSGLDGAGKTTQIKMLLSYYQQRGFKTGSIYDLFPDIRYHSVVDLRYAYDFLRKYDVIHMRFRLNSDRNSVIMHKLEQSPFPKPITAIAAAIQGYQDHLLLYRYVLEPLLKGGKIILFDRYFYDELAFKHVYGCPCFILKMLYANVQAADIPFYIRISPQDCQERNRTRLEETAAIYQNIKRISNLAKNFDDIAAQKGMTVLNGINTAEKIFKQIILSLDRLDA